APAPAPRRRDALRYVAAGGVRTTPPASPAAAPSPSALSYHTPPDRRTANRSRSRLSPRAARRPTRDTSRVGTGRESGTLGDPCAPHVAAGEAMRAGRVPRMPRWLRQPRHGSRAWYCPFTLASGSDPRHESRVALLGVRPTNGKRNALRSSD